jgi:hypothetical protein
MHAAWTCQVGANDIRPLDAGIDLQQAAILIETPHPLEPAGVEHRAAAKELLPTHRVPPAGNRERAVFHSTASYNLYDLLDRLGLKCPRHRRTVETRVGVIHPVMAGVA